MEKLSANKIVFAVIAILISNIAYCQIDDHDPSTWPKPTIENITDDGFFDSKDKLQVYYKWLEKYRAEKLPNLYLLEKDKLSLDCCLKPEFYLKEISSKKELNISFDSLKCISFTPINALKKDVLSSSNPCNLFYTKFYEIISIEIDSLASKVKLTKFNCTSIDNLMNDDLTKYKVERKGDSLEIKFNYE